MAASKDFSDPLREEVLIQMADTFFRPRKALEEEMDGVLDYAKRLRQRQVQVEGCASLLHHLLVDPQEVEAFWALLDVDTRALYTDIPPRVDCVPHRSPLALTARRRFAKWVERIYGALRAERDVYMNGPPRPGAEAGDREPIVYFRLVETMTDLVNEHVRRLNRSGSLSTALQTAKQFQPTQVDRERITGATSELFAPGFEERLCYRPIDFGALGIKAFPMLPDWKTNQKRLDPFLDGCYRKHAGQIRRRMAALGSGNAGIDKSA